MGCRSGWDAGLDGMSHPPKDDVIGFLYPSRKAVTNSEFLVTTFKASHFLRHCAGVLWNRCLRQAFFSFFTSYLVCLALWDMIMGGVY